MTTNILNPIHQFEIFSIIELSLGSFNISFSNVSFYVFIVIAISSLFLFLTSYNRRMIPSRMQSISELAYEFVVSMLRTSLGNTKGMQFLPFVFSLFIFILIANFIGLFPYFYTITSQIAVTFTLAMLVFTTVLLYGFCKHGFHFFKVFVPVGVPVILVPLVIIIEIISFLSRPISLSVRLFANVLAGHITLKVFAGFIVSMISLGPLYAGASIMPLMMTVVITALECLVAFLQAYVFTVLTCMYLQDATHPEH